MKVAIVGGGAAGFFAAISAKEHHPQAQVTLFEKSRKLLAKVRISGGGRCNVTNACFSISTLSKAYPRGGKQLKKIFPVFNPRHTMDWFEQRGVPLKIEAHNHVFPVSDSSESIIKCLMKEAEKLNVNIRIATNVIAIKPNGLKIDLSILKDERTYVFDKVILASGGSPKRSGLEWLEDLGHQIEEPVPSLFTFNMPDEPVKKLMGVAIPDVLVRIPGEKLSSVGPLLITHWGMSGPAILKLSAFGARVLSNRNYDFTILINWANEVNDQIVYAQLAERLKEFGNKLIPKLKPYGLPERFWLYVLDRSEIDADKRCSEIGKKALNKLTTVLTNDIYKVKGKTTFKEEFVTCGGISLDNINMKTMESKVLPNVYFAGELMDIDAITGGYNFQAAWTTGFIAGKLQ